MIELWVISSFVFATTLLAVVAVGLTFETRTTRRSISRRLALTARLASCSDVLEALRRERGLIDTPIPAFFGINDFLTQTGLRLDRNSLLLWILVLGASTFVLFGLLLGFGFLSFVLGIVSALVLVIAYCRVMRRRRIARFADLLPDAIDVLVRGVRVGYPLPLALELVAREMPDPVGTEFGMTADEISFGRDIKTAMENLYRRVGQQDLPFLVVAINVQSQTGGNLAEVLTRLARLIRSRSKVALRVRALSAEGRMSARSLTVMPFALVGIISLLSPSFYADLRHHPALEPALIYAVLSLIAGNMIMYRMVNFKF